MKTAIIILLVLSFGLVLLTYKPTEIIKVAVLRDITDLHQAKPDTLEIIKLFDLRDENIWNDVQFTFSNVSDVSYEKRQKASIPGENKWLGNEIERIKEVNNFKKEVTEIIEKSKEDSIGKNYSSVFIPVSHALLDLEKSKANRKVLLIYSDLMENNLDVSLYSEKEYLALKYNPDSIKKIFAEFQNLPDLKGIEVKLIYLPINAMDDKRYRIISGFLRSILESKGAVVTIGGNLEN